MIRRIALPAILASVLVCGCTATPTAPPTSSAVSSPAVTAPSSTPTPAPTPTWNANQTAAIAAVQGYTEVSNRVSSNPSGFSKAEVAKMLEGFVGPAMVTSNQGYFASLIRKGVRLEGGIRLLSATASAVSDKHNSRGLEVQVTACQDQRSVKVVDQKSGDVVGPEQAKVPAFNLRQFSVRKPAKATRWLVFEMETVKGECGA